ncbi:MAG TPA: hypothetical protein VHH88_07090 [Verrucomicrobiae bacterium]|nr:hypothetical protein [Verrucomicrobiae bacterium]
MRTPLTGRAKWLAWIAVLAALTLVVFGCLLVGGSSSGQPVRLIGPAIVIALALSALGIAGAYFFSWVRLGKNFRRFLFGVACLITLIALFYAEEDWRGRRAWRLHKQKWEAKGEKFDIQGFVPPAVPDDQNFALTPLLKPIYEFTESRKGMVQTDTNAMARLEKTDPEVQGENRQSRLELGDFEKGEFADLPACAAFYIGNTNYPQAAAGSSPGKLILTALGKFGPEIKELREAAATRPYSRFPIHYDTQPPWSILLPHLSSIKRLSQMMCIHAVAELDAGQSAEALIDLKVALRLSGSIHDEPFLISHLVRLVTLKMALQTLREGLARHAWSDAEIVSLQGNLNEVELLSEYKRAMRGERALSTEGIAQMQSHVKEIGFFDNSGGVAALAAIIPAGWFYQNMVVISRMHQEFTLSVVNEKDHRVFPQISRDGAAAFQRLPRTPETILARILMPAFEKASRQTAIAQARLDCALAACALERFRIANGKFPESLSQLTPRFLKATSHDVMDGEPLHYRREAGGGYVLYSVGWNQTDEGGKVALKQNRKDSTVDEERGDWVWTMPAQL